MEDISEELEIITQEKKRIADERGLIVEEKSENESKLFRMTVQRDLSTVLN